MSRTKAQRRAAKRARAANKVIVPAVAKAESMVVNAVDLEAEAKRKVAEVLRTTTPMSWYMLRVYGGERAVEDALRGRGFDVYVPRQVFGGKRLGRAVKIIRPIFYGYVFVCIDHNSGQRFDQVTLEHGVAGFLTRCGTDQPRMMRPWYVERLRLSEEFGLFDNRPKASRKLVEGDLIWIAAGEFGDHFARVLRAKPGDLRVRLLLEAMDAADDEVSVDVKKVRAAWTGGREPKIGEAA